MLREYRFVLLLSNYVLIIAEYIGYSKFHLSRCFQRKKGVTIHQYVKAKRLENAAKQLISSEQSIVDIAIEAQYSSQPAFTAAFRQYYHCTPQIFRERFATKCMGSGVMAA